MELALVNFCVVVLVAVMVNFAGAQSPSFQPNNQTQFSNTPFSPQIAIIFVFLIVAVFALGYCSIYLRQCYGSPGTATNFQGAAVRTWRGTRGLDREIIENFPIFSYAEVKDHKIGKGALECAVCLNEFDDGDTLQLLPKCDHVFHQECIGKWLEHHITCPVCRSDLTKPAAEVPPVAVEITENNAVDVNGSRQRQGEIAIQIDEIQADNGDTKSPRSEASNNAPRSRSIGKSEAFDLAKFRSHTTGHSPVLPGGNLDRFTLKLPHRVRKEVMERCMLDRTRSSAAGLSTFNSESVRGGARFFQKFQWSMKSDRRAIFTRTMTMFSPKVSTDGGNGSGGRATTRLSSLKCLEPKAADKTV